MNRKRRIVSFSLLGNLIFLFYLGILLVGCGDNNTEYTHTRYTVRSGTIHISVDEAFKPVIDSQVKVFESQNPDAKIIVHYKPEAQCLQDLDVDSIRMLIGTRGLTREEENAFHKKLRYHPGYGPLAWDAVAVITNKNSPDSLFTMDEIRDLVKGTGKPKYKVLMDGTSATSNVRFLMDSVLKAGDTLSSNVVAAQSSEAVIDYVTRNTDAIGLIGVSWIGDKNDPQVLNFLSNVRVAALECRDCDGKFVLPVQANIALGRYPMVRPLYYILKENYAGLGSGFKNFLIHEKGQLIFRRAYLLPARMSFDVRDMSISE